MPGKGSPPFLPRTVALGSSTSANSELLSLASVSMQCGSCIAISGIRAKVKQDTRLHLVSPPVLLQPRGDRPHSLTLRLWYMGTVWTVVGPISSTSLSREASEWCRLSLAVRSHAHSCHIRCLFECPM